MFEVSSCRVSGLSYRAQARDYPNSVNRKKTRQREISILPHKVRWDTLSECLTNSKLLPVVETISVMLNPFFSTDEACFRTLQTPDHFLEGKKVKSLCQQTIPQHTPVKRRVNAPIKRRVDTFICSFLSLD